jgi:hypothetical protein
MEQPSVTKPILYNTLERWFGALYRRQSSRTFTGLRLKAFRNPLCYSGIDMPKFHIVDDNGILFTYDNLNKAREKLKWLNGEDTTYRLRTELEPKKRRSE